MARSPIPSRRLAPLWAAAASAILSPATLGFAAFLPAQPRRMAPPAAAGAARFLSSPPDGGDLEDLRVPELKDRLRSLGQKVGGKKAELIERLRSAEGMDPPPPPAYDAVPSNAVVILACKS